VGATEGDRRGRPAVFTTVAPVPEIVIAADGQWVVEEVSAVLSGPDNRVVVLDRGLAVLPYVEDHVVDLLILDMQVGNMGGPAICQELRLEERSDRLDRIPVLLLLDRRADVFIARRMDAEGWLVKPLDPIRLRRAINALLEGGTYFDESYSPLPVQVPIPTGPGPGTATAGPAALADDPPAALHSPAVG
jgi:DNA-binding response OmpR family regulator